MLPALIVWLAGLLTLVPYGVHYLFVNASREQYAVLITFLLFWVFGYWGVAGPILAIVKSRRLLKRLEAAHAEGRLKEALRSQETADVAVDWVASENKIPRFLAARLVRLLARRLSSIEDSRPTESRSSGLPS